MSDTMHPKMVTDALLMALWRRGKPSELMHHSDQGSQYTSEDFQLLLKDQGVTCSMSRRGDCWDNAAMESFSSSLKTERLIRKVYRTRDEVRAMGKRTVKQEPLKTRAAAQTAPSRISYAAHRRDAAHNSM